MYFWLLPRQLSLKWDNFYFLTPKTHFRALEGSKNKNCSISTKFGVVIVKSTLIKKTKKNFEFFHFWANFFSWSAHARLVKEIFFAKKLIFVHIFIWDVQIFYQVGHLKSGSAIFTVVNLASGPKPSALRGLWPP